MTNGATDSDTGRRRALSSDRAEAPVHVELIYERIRDRYGLKRAGSAIQGRIDYALKDAEKQGVIERLHGEPSFINWPGRAASPRAPESVFSPRGVEQVSIAELVAGLVVVATQLYGAEVDALIRETARGFGYLRLGDNIQRRLRAALRKAIRDGQLTAVGDLIVPTIAGRPD